MPAAPHPASIAIACGGTGGHLFPGLAVAAALRERGLEVSLFISLKDVDREAVRGVIGMEVVPLEAVGLDARRPWRFAVGLVGAWRRVAARFRKRPPAAVLGMGGFTSAAPVLAGRRCGARVFLHESNAIPGRATRWLAPRVDGVFMGFEGVAHRLRAARVWATGTPVRPSFRPRDPSACRRALGLDPGRPTLLVMGGSQGASGINRLLEASLPALARELPDLQYVHLAGHRDSEWVAALYAEAGRTALVRPFLAEMEMVLGAADLAVSRAGASSLAEFAAMQLPPVLIPFPAAANNHQWYNARQLVDSGAAALLDQGTASAGTFVPLVVDLLRDVARRASMRMALARWHHPDAAPRIASVILDSLRGEAWAGAAAQEGAFAGEPQDEETPRTPRRAAACGSAEGGTA